MSNPSRDFTIIRAASPFDALSMATIYNHYIEHTVVTFEEQSVTAEEIARRVEGVQSSSLPWLVAERGNAVVGYAYASRWHPRSAYRMSVEATVYLDAACARRGIGSALYAEMLPMLQAQGIHVVLGIIALPNEASVALHERFGMRKVTHFSEVGFKFNRWVDVGYWQLIFRP